MALLRPRRDRVSSDITCDLPGTRIAHDRDCSRNASASRHPCHHKEVRHMTEDTRGHRKRTRTIAAAIVVGVAATALTLSGQVAFGEILGLVNYETKSADSLKALKRPIAPPARKEGLAVVDLEPGSKTFGQVVKSIDLPGDTVDQDRKRDE